MDIPGGIKKLTIFKFIISVCDGRGCSTYQNVQLFIGSKSDILHVAIFEYSLHKFRETTIPINESMTFDCRTQSGNSLEIGSKFELSITLKLKSQNTIQSNHSNHENFGRNPTQQLIEPMLCLIERVRSSADSIGVARGCSGCTCTPRAVKKNFSGLIYRKNV